MTLFLHILLRDSHSWLMARHIFSGCCVALVNLSGFSPTVWYHIVGPTLSYPCKILNVWIKSHFIRRFAPFQDRQYHLGSKETRKVQQIPCVEVHTICRARTLEALLLAFSHWDEGFIDLWMITPISLSFSVTSRLIPFIV